MPRRGRVPGPRITAHSTLTMCCTGAHFDPSTGKEIRLPTTASAQKTPASANFFTLFRFISYSPLSCILAEQAAFHRVALYFTESLKRAGRGLLASSHAGTRLPFAMVGSAPGAPPVGRCGNFRRRLSATKRREFYISYFRATWSARARISRVALALSTAANSAEITATPSTPHPASCGRLSLLIPPIATTGMRTARQIFCNSASASRPASVLVVLPNTAPHPR